MMAKARMGLTRKREATAGCRGKHTEVASQWAVGLIGRLDVSRRFTVNVEPVFLHVPRNQIKL
jgi:hypothetical protein